MKPVIKELESQEELDTYLSSGGRCFVCYYASWCPHCVKMEPEWVRLAEKIVRLSIPIHILRIEQKNIEGTTITTYPTIKYKYKNHTEQYKGQRTMDDMFSFLKERVTCHQCKKITLH
jgi:thiol-disulfide isomerase/thioredoxin